MIIQGVRIIPVGDTFKSRQLIPDGRRVMLILENMMRLRNLDQLTIRMEPYPGALITCSKVFGAKTMTIRTPTVGGAREESPQRWCLCNCNFAAGFVLKTRDEKLDDTISLYDVMVCQGSDRYMLIENVLASDFTLYEDGQSVLVIPYYNMGFLCCTSGNGLVTGCRVDRSLQGEDGRPITDEEWRSAIRIIPWCGFTLPKWTRKKLRNNG